MKLRTLILLSYGIGVILVTLILGFSAYKMIFKTSLVIFTICITLGASILAFTINYILLLPMFKAIDKLSRESREIAQGKFSGKVEVSGSLETRMLAEDFNEMSARLGEMFQKTKDGERERNELIANLSHDIKTPIASIRSFSEALLDGVLVEEREKQQYLRTIQRETVRLGDLVNELMELSAIEKVESNINIVRIWIDQLLLDVLQMFDVQLKREDRELCVQIEPDCKFIYANPNFIVRILCNLIENALKFSEVGTNIEITVKREKKKMFFLVKDYGIGISLEEQKRIFERLYRVEKSRNLAHGGSGLGLHIASNLAQLSEGELSVSSSPNNGSTFVLEVPINETYMIS